MRTPAIFGFVAVFLFAICGAAFVWFTTPDPKKGKSPPQ